MKNLQLSPPLATPALPVLEIIRLHGEIVTAARTSLDKAIRIGELLAEQKANLDHGQWLPWLKSNIPFAERTAQNYLRCFHQRDQLKSASVADLTDAYQLLAGPGPLQAQYEQEALELNSEHERRTDLLAYVRHVSRNNPPPVYPEHIFPDWFSAPVEITDLPVAEITVDLEINNRSDRDADWTKWLAQIPDLTPPIAVFKIGNGYSLADGRYRLDAAKLTAATHIRARIYTGTKQDALKYFCAANSRHGKPYTAQQWQRAMERQPA